MVGGFGLVGAPLTLIDALVEHSDATDLTIVSNNIGEPGRGLGRLLRAGAHPARHRRPTSRRTPRPWPRSTPARSRRRSCRRARSPRRSAPAARASAASTRRSAPARSLAEGKEERLIDGVPHVLERPIRADVALVYAARADVLGNLWYRRTARNFNPVMATAATLAIAEAGEIVPAGDLSPSPS